jgi:hypothetical protein
MCNQTVGLVQGALEAAGIATVSLTLLPEVTRKVRPPRALSMPFSFGYPLGQPFDRVLHRKIVLDALALLARTSVPVLEDFRNTEE